MSTKTKKNKPPNILSELYPVLFQKSTKIPCLRRLSVLSGQYHTTQSQLYFTQPVSTNTITTKAARTNSPHQHKSSPKSKAPLHHPERGLLLVFCDVALHPTHPHPSPKQNKNTIHSTLRHQHKAATPTFKRTDQFHYYFLSFK